MQSLGRCNQQRLRISEEQKTCLPSEQLNLPVKVEEEALLNIYRDELEEQQLRHGLKDNNIPPFCTSTLLCTL